MSKSTFFTGQPIFCQLLNLIPRHLIASSVKEHSSDRYYKRYKSYDHLVTMLYTCFQKCSSLREVVTGLMACHHRLSHLGLKYVPRRSTLSEANNNRSHEFFSAVYERLYHTYYHFSPDSRLKGSIENRLFLIDSTTISLFSDIMKGMGSHPVNGKKKGGAKAHLVVKASEDVPVYSIITHASKSDKEIFKHVDLPEGAIVVFDKGYNSYEKFAEFNSQSITWVTRISDVAYQELIAHLPVSEKEKEAGVIADDKVLLGRPSNRKTKKIAVRRITFYDSVTKKTFVFITNHKTFKASTIAAIYKRRWQIELLFKRLKQSYPLKHFLGESENAIKVQIWCALITDLLLSIVKKQLKKKWSFANICSMVRLHLMNYLDLILFLENPEKSLMNYSERLNQQQPSLFSSA